MSDEGEAMDALLPQDAARARLIGRVWRADLRLPTVVAVRAGRAIDIGATVPTIADLLRHPDPAGLWAAEGEDLGPVEALLAPPDLAWPGSPRSCLLAPVDLQPVKACGVTFTRSLLERVVDERSRGDPARAAQLRAELEALLGGTLQDVRPGSPEALEVRARLQQEGLWSQYLEVGLGPDAEVFTKAAPLAAVGPGAWVGIRPESRWNNPEPEVVLAIAPDGRPVAATLGNDVNLRDFEGRSALLLGKAKDNDGSCAVGPFLRLFDDEFRFEPKLMEVEVELEVMGEDGFHLHDRHPLAEIGRPPAELIAQTIGPHHGYPDGVVLFLGTMFAPVQDREAAGMGFTHHPGDRVRIRSDHLGMLENRVGHTGTIPGWRYGLRDLMADLARRRRL